jgi:uncharacterized protein (DUF2062 family)
MRELSESILRTDNLIVMIGNSFNSMKRKAEVWLRQGISPRRLALTLALGFAIGCLPLLGITTLLCAGLALALGLNLPAITAANYAVMPLQVLLIVPFARLGGWLFTFGPRQSFSSVALLHASPQAFVSQLGSLAGLALLAWLVTAIPAIALMTFTLTPLLRRVPALSAAESSDTRTA